MAVGANLTAPRTGLIPDQVPGGADDPAANEVTPAESTFFVCFLFFLRAGIRKAFTKKKEMQAVMECGGFYFI